MHCTECAAFACNRTDGWVVLDEDTSIVEEVVVEPWQLGNNVEAVAT